MSSSSYPTSQTSTSSETSVTQDALKETYICWNGSIVWFDGPLDGITHKYQGLGRAWVHDCEYEDEDDDTPLLPPLAVPTPKPITIKPTITGSKFIEVFEDEPRVSVASESTAVSSTHSEPELVKMPTPVVSRKSRKMKIKEKVKSVFKKLLK